MSEVEVTAPAPTPEPTTISAAVDAASRDDFAAFDAAESAKARGETVARVEAPKAAAPAPADTDIQLSKRQQAANDRTRAAVEQATADLRAENARLKALTEAAAPRREEPAPAAKTPEWKRYMAMPDAPKLADFESVEEHAIAAALFITDTRDRERQADTSARHHDEQRARFLTERGQEYGERLIKAKEADPDIVSKIAPPILAARPASGLAAGEIVTFSNLVAETGLFSPDPAKLYVHLSAHPDEATAIANLPTKDLALAALARLDGRLSGAPVTATAQTPPAAPAARPSTITAAPPPAQTPARTGITTDPKAAALARDDFAAFDRIDQEERRARRSA